MARPVIFVALAAVVAQAIAPAAAQQIDPRALQQLQGTLGAGALAPNSGQALDAARAGQIQQGQPGAVLPGQRVDTPEEQEVRRAEARRQLSRIYRPSTIEREFRDRLGDPTLRQFGYDLFQVAQGGNGGSLTGAVSDSYVVGVGDDLVVQFQGATNDSKTVRVDREGKLVVGTLPPVPAAGRSIGAVTRDLKAAVRRTLLGTDAYVSLGSVRAVTVFVGGEVERPGQYNLTSLSDVSAALAQAGGVRRSGSLRSVKIVRPGGGTTIVDLYGLLGIGTPPSTRLSDGDRIIVPVIGPTVAVAGSVARPGIYELRGKASLEGVLGYAGGALRPRGNQIAISRIGREGTESYVRAPAHIPDIHPRDPKHQACGSAGGTTGRVVLRGFVANPGPRALSAAPTVRDLVGNVDELRFDTYLPAAILIRRDPQTASRVYETIDLLQAVNGQSRVALRSDDRLYIFGRSDIDFLNQFAVRRIVLGQPNPLPECVSLDRLEALVRDTQSSRFSVITRGSFIVERSGRSELASAGAAITGQNRSVDETLRSGDDSAGLARARTDATLTRENDPGSNGQVTTGQADAAQLRVQRDSDRCPAVFEEEPELLPVLIESAVGVGGAVRRPGAYPIGAATSAAELAAVAGGIIGNGVGLTLDVTTSTGTEISQRRVATEGYPTALQQTILRSGDDLRFNSAQPQFEAGGVLLSGEFNRPGLYSIRKGETLSQLIARAGGLSPLAYPYGAIFTRRSVKEQQQEGLRRTGRELATSLLSVSARKESNAGALAAGQQLIQQLSTVEAPGRVVIEADPRVLAVRPDLDTVLESGDALVMPKRPNFVLALGDVSNPGALQFIPGKRAGDYLRESGGLQSSADGKRAFLVLPNGAAQPVSNSHGWSDGRDVVVPPGSTIIVPKNIDPLYKLDVARDVAGIVGGLIQSVATLAILATN